MDLLPCYFFVDPCTKFRWQTKEVAMGFIVLEPAGRQRERQGETAFHLASFVAGYRSRSQLLRSCLLVRLPRS